MRPLTAVSRSDGAHLLGAHGAYCAICERPVPAEFWLLDTVTGGVLEAGGAEASGAGLILCHDCAGRHGGGAVDALALPHRDTTFTIGARSAFRYAIEPATVTQIGADGTSHSDNQDLVFVLGTTTAARATIDRFALNSPYLGATGRVLTIPWAHRSPVLDRRVFLRTTAWHRAQALAERLTTDSGTLRAMARDLIAGVGFWSVFATVLHASTGDRDLVADLLLPNTARRGPARFPGTRGDLR